MNALFEGPDALRICSVSLNLFTQCNAAFFSLLSYNTKGTEVFVACISSTAVPKEEEPRAPLLF